MIRSFVRPAALALTFAALAIGIAVLPPTPAQGATFTFSNSGCNSFNLVDNGGGNFTLNCQTTAPGTFSCPISASPSAPTVTQAVTLTATCSNATGGVTYTWSATGGPAGCPAITPETNPAKADLAAPGGTTALSNCSYTLSAIDSATIPNQTTGNKLVSYSSGGGGGGGGGGGINCSAQGFANTTVINENWASPSTNVVAKMGVNDAIVVQFTTGSATSSNLTRVSAGEWQSTPSNRQGTLSTQSCDFGTGVGGYGSTSSGSSITMYFSVGKANNFGFPQLATNTTYFVNIQNTQPNPACAVNGICDMFISLYKGSGL